ncbi:MAG: hypothetical protein KIS94_15210 [Chitinophagales bacterium]|nr:hypothetical protein [Chitinophagales bacterium]
MTKYLLYALLLVSLLYLESCGRKPYACFMTEPDEEEIHVNQPVTFYAGCSINAETFFWEFYGNDDSTDYGYSTTRTFYTPGQVKVFLIVVGQGKSTATERYITVQP